MFDQVTIGEVLGWPLKGGVSKLGHRVCGTADEDCDNIVVLAQKAGDDVVDVAEQREGKVVSAVDRGRYDAVAVELLMQSRDVLGKMCRGGGHLEGN